MSIRDGYLEEDLFPKLFINFEERSYGILFYNEANRDSYDSNHAVICRGRIDDRFVTRYSLAWRDIA